jgi:hypothetical protein
MITLASTPQGLVLPGILAALLAGPLIRRQPWGGW